MKSLGLTLLAKGVGFTPKARRVMKGFRAGEVPPPLRFRKLAVRGSGEASSGTCCK